VLRKSLHPLEVRGRKLSCWYH